MEYEGNSSFTENSLPSQNLMDARVDANKVRTRKNFTKIFLSNDEISQLKTSSYKSVLKCRPNGYGCVAILIKKVVNFIQIDV